MSNEGSSAQGDRRTIIWKTDAEDGPEVIYEGKRYRVAGFRPQSYRRLVGLASRLLDEAGDNADTQHVEASIHGAIFLQTSALECLVNDVLIDFVLDRYGPDDSKHIAESMLSGSLRSKVLRVVPILTHGRRRLDIETPGVQAIFRLISQRNSLAHVTNHFRESLKEPTGPSREDARKYGEAVVALAAAISREYHAEFRHDAIEEGGGDEEAGPLVVDAPEPGEDIWWLTVSQPEDGGAEGMIRPARGPADM